jgi:superfamily II DNA or RNA helicase
MARKLNISLPLFEAESTSASEIVLRPYQDRAVRLLRMHNTSGKKRVLCVAPTRAGKTIIIVAVTKATKLPVIVVAHRMELIDQAVAQLARAGLTNVGVLRGDDERENPNASVQVCSIATLARREKPYKEQRCIIFIDEAHRSCSDSYIQHIFEAYPEAFIVGFTATPCRLDGKPLGDLYEVLEVVATYQELFKRPDWLIAPDVYASPLQADLSKVRTIAGDYDEGALAEVMHQKDLEGNVVEHWLKYAHLHPMFSPKGDRLPGKFAPGERRATFLFASGIDHSLSLCQRFEAQGVRIAHLDGTTPEEQRRAALRDLAAGKIEILSNVNILLEGVDLPEAKCVVHARPTQSITLWRQSACRIMTPHKGIVPLLLDHAGNMDRLYAPYEDVNWSLTGRPARRSSAPAMKVCSTCYAYVLAGRASCPYCGVAFSSDSSERQVPNETPDELQKRSTEPLDLRKQFFDKQVEFARARGFKPGFASAKYKERYKDWPPKDWGELAKWEYAKDVNWQRALDSRERRRAAKKEASEREEQAAVEAARTELGDEEEVAPEDPFVADDDDSFAGWVEQQGIAVHKHGGTQ